jgi:hypothetical protein
MVRGAPTFVLCGVVWCACAGSAFAFGDYAGRIATPVGPYAVAYASSSQYLVVCQLSDGQAGRYRISSPEQSAQLEPIFNPVAGGDAVGLAWVESEQALYWLVETTQNGSRTYRLYLTNIDGWSVPGGVQLDVAADAVLGEMTYVPSQDALWVADVVNDRFISFNRATGARRTGGEFYSPVRHRDALTSYGMGIEFVPVGPGYFDLLVGTLTDQRAARVIRVDLLGNPVGAGFTVDVGDRSVRPGWPAGLAYCDGTGKHFTAIADMTRRAVLLFDTPVPQAFGLTDVKSTVAEDPVVDGKTVESIKATFTWKNNGVYNSIGLESRDPVSGDFITIATTPGSTTTITQEVGKEGRFTFRLTPVIGTSKVPSSEVEVRTAAGAILGITQIASGSQTAQPFGIAVIEDEQGQTLLVADTVPQTSESSALVRRYHRAVGGALETLTTIYAPFGGAGYIIVGLDWDSTRQELVWLGLSSARNYEIAVTDANGVVKATMLPFVRNPFLQDQLGDIAYDAQRKVFWVPSIDRNAVCSFARAADGASFVATGTTLSLPTTLPGERGTWGLPCGVSVAPGPYAADTVLYVTMGQLSDDPDYPPLGAGYVKRVVPMLLRDGKAPVASGMPIDLELATGSAELRGITVSSTATPSVFVAAEDVGCLYEVRLLGEGPLFSRGDVNADAKLDVADAQFLLAYLFAAGSPAPSCMDAADINDNGLLNLGDALALLRHVFGMTSQVPLAIPFSMCATDPAVDTLPCAAYQPCAR